MLLYHWSSKGKSDNKTCLGNFWKETVIIKFVLELHDLFCTLNAHNHSLPFFFFLFCFCFVCLFFFSYRKNCSTERFWLDRAKMFTDCFCFLRPFELTFFLRSFPPDHRVCDKGTSTELSSALQKSADFCTESATSTFHLHQWTGVREFWVQIKCSQREFLFHGSTVLAYSRYPTILLVTCYLNAAFPWTQEYKIVTNDKGYRWSQMYRWPWTMDIICDKISLSAHFLKTSNPVPLFNRTFHFWVESKSM